VARSDRIAPGSDSFPVDLSVTAGKSSLVDASHFSYSCRRINYLFIQMQSFRFHRAVARWFEQTFGSPTEPQIRGWPAIQSGRHVLISAPTGSGKTLAAFLASLDALFREGVDVDLPDETRAVYVSPLKALSNDIRKNLQEPLA